MRPQLCLFAAFVFSTALSTISAFSFQKNGLSIPKTGASPDLGTAAESLSQKSVTKASNNQFMNYMPTRRDTIKMPSVTPMVPWTVRFVVFIEMEREDALCPFMDCTQINTILIFISFLSMLLFATF